MPLPSIPELASLARASVVQVQRTGSQGAGTGIIHSSDGEILTNHHVIASRKGVASDVTVTLADGRNLPARVLRSNPQLDLALLKVDARDLPALPLADSAGTRVGEWVFAIGHPWGERNVLTHGVLSARGSRNAPDGKHMIPYLRSDVQLAPGNSGGPLLNARGEVIGINAMIWGGDMAIAIPSNTATAWLESVPA